MFLLIFPLFTCPFIICPAGSGSAGRSSSRPASYAVVRRTSWYGSGLESEHKQPTEENVVSAGGFGFLFASLQTSSIVPVSVLLSSISSITATFSVAYSLLHSRMVSVGRGFPPGILPSARFCLRAMMLLLCCSWCTCALTRDGVRIRRIVQILREDCHAVS